MGAQQCAAATCSDGIQDWFETAIDCGGVNCPETCAVGQTCTANTDCLGWSTSDATQSTAYCDTISTQVRHTFFFLFSFLLAACLPSRPRSLLPFSWLVGWLIGWMVWCGLVWFWCWMGWWLLLMMGDNGIGNLEWEWEWE